MLYFDRIGVSERTDVNKTSALKECDICHYLLIKGSKFQPNVCNKCRGLLMISVNLGNIAILNIKGADYCRIISRSSKKWSYKLNAKCQFFWKKQNIMKHKPFGDIETGDIEPFGDI